MKLLHSDMFYMFPSHMLYYHTYRLRDFDPEEDEPVLNPSWPHLQIVYEFLLRFIVHSAIQAKTCKKIVDADFCFKLIELFDSEDPRERDYLKTILHRIYGKFMPHRSSIRTHIQNVFYRYALTTAIGCYQYSSSLW
jgi:serine/threonine-protein phosphatase 2A regulatory subunit B'